MFMFMFYYATPEQMQRNRFRDAHDRGIYVLGCAIMLSPTFTTGCTLRLTGAKRRLGVGVVGLVDG